MQLARRSAALRADVRARDLPVQRARRSGRHQVSLLGAVQLREGVLARGRRRAAVEGGGRVRGAVRGGNVVEFVRRRGGGDHLRARERFRADEQDWR